MKNMKNTVTFVFLMIVLSVILCGCGKKKPAVDPSTAPASSAATEAATVVQTEPSTEDETYKLEYAAAAKDFANLIACGDYAGAYGMTVISKTSPFITDFDFSAYVPGSELGQLTGMQAEPKVLDVSGNADAAAVTLRCAPESADLVLNFVRDGENILADYDAFAVSNWTIKTFPLWNVYIDGVLLTELNTKKTVEGDTATYTLPHVPAREVVVEWKYEAENSPAINSAKAEPSNGGMFDLWTDCIARATVDKAWSITAPMYIRQKSTDKYGDPIYISVLTSFEFPAVITTNEAGADVYSFAQPFWQNNNSMSSMKVHLTTPFGVFVTRITPGENAFMPETRPVELSVKELIVPDQDEDPAAYAEYEKRDVLAFVDRAVAAVAKMTKEEFALAFVSPSVAPYERKLMGERLYDRILETSAKGTYEGAEYYNNYHNKADASAVAVNVFKFPVKTVWSGTGETSYETETVFSFEEGQLWFYDASEKLFMTYYRGW